MSDNFQNGKSAPVKTGDERLPKPETKENWKEVSANKIFDKNFSSRALDVEIRRLVQDSRWGSLPFEDESE